MLQVEGQSALTADRFGAIIGQFGWMDKTAAAAWAMQQARSSVTTRAPRNEGMWRMLCLLASFPQFGQIALIAVVSAGLGHVIVAMQSARTW